jgi:hypothetical protein
LLVLQLVLLLLLLALLLLEPWLRLLLAVGKVEGFLEL